MFRGRGRKVKLVCNQRACFHCSDRISAFDVILPRPVPFKGQVLNQIAAYMLNSTRDICPNWLLDVPAPTVSIGKRCVPFKIEMVVRGNMTGHAWRTYVSGKRTLCGAILPEGIPPICQLFKGSRAFLLKGGNRHRGRGPLNAVPSGLD